MVSPIEVLLENLGNSIINIAPEKEEEFKKLHTEQPFSFDIYYDCIFRFKVDTETREFKIDIAALELLWISSYMFYTLYNDFKVAQGKGGFCFNLDKYPKSKQAFNLYKWSQQKIKEKNKSFWPISFGLFPKPEKNPEPGSEEYKNNQLFYIAAAWMFQHEVAHVRLNHPNVTSRSILEEKEADKAATEWIFSGNLSDNDLIFRGLGMAAALLAIGGLDFEKGSFDSITHPRFFQRIYDCFNLLKIDEGDHILYAFIVYILNFYMTNAGIPFKRNYDEKKKFKYYFEEYCLALAQYNPNCN